MPTIWPDVPSSEGANTGRAHLVTRTDFLLCHGSATAFPTTDPTPVNGMMVFRSDEGLFYARIAGAWQRAGLAPEEAIYIVKTAHSALSAERVATDSSFITWDWSTGGQVSLTIPDGALTFAKIASAAIDTDGTGASASASKFWTSAAAKTYADQLIAAADAMVFKGSIDCSANPNYPAADAGHTYRVSVAGKIGGASGTNVEAGDLLLCKTDSTASGNQATVGSAWTITQTNVDGGVVGPASATDSALVRFDGTTGKLIKGGSTLVIGDFADGVITLAKLANVSATKRVIGRNTAAAGVPEEVTVSQLLDWAGTAANGDTLYRTGGAWALLPKGTDGQVMQLAGGVPSWADSGALTDGDKGDVVVASSGASWLLDMTALAAKFTSPQSGIINGYIAVSVASNAVTFAVKGYDGNDPSATNKVYVLATLTNGLPTILELTAALSLTVSSGSTLGVPTNNKAFRVWIGVFNDAGTARLGVINCKAPTYIFPLGGSTLIGTSTAEGGAGAADAVGTWYTGTAVSAKPYVPVAYATWESGLAAVGTWAGGPTCVKLLGVGDKLPGDVVQRVRLDPTTAQTSTSTSLADVSGATITIQPTSAANQVEVDLAWVGAVAAQSGQISYYTAAVLRDSTEISVTDYLRGNTDSASGANAWSGGFAFKKLDDPASASSLVYKLQHKTLASGGGSPTVTTKNACGQCCEIMA
ncbi:MAG TPA: hypothetical protein VG735_08085 [Caulobacterales bacterium]|nr:hypothetical protein [Caulobacterales bacterium]